MMLKTAAAIALAGLTAASPVDAGTGSSSSSEAPSPTQPAGATRFTATAVDAIAAAAATALVSTSVSNVRGAAFDRFVIIMMENADYNVTESDPNFAHYASKGIKLTNYCGVTHPSEPNYVGAIAGDHFGMQNDDMNFLDESVATVIDLLEEGGVSWSTYQEGKPFAGYGGFDYDNPGTGKLEYVRKHDGIQIANSVANSPLRISLDKNLSMEFPERSSFHQDLANNLLSQWIWITPNMTSDGHDTNATVAGQWTRNFLDPLLDDPHFMNRTLVFICWDENASLHERNHILGVLIGDAVPEELVGTEDDTFYNQYSIISTTSANWGLHHLGRWDVGANPLAIVARQTGDTLRRWESNGGVLPLLNDSYAGPFNDERRTTEYPAPNIDLVTCTGRTVLPKVKTAWEGRVESTYYEDTVEIPDRANPPAGWEV